MKSQRDYLIDVLEYIGYLESFMSEGREIYESDIKTRLATSKAYEMIGEFLKRLPLSLLNKQPQIRWKAIKGFRDVLSHQYDAVEHDIVWGAIEDLPALRIAVQALLTTLPADDNPPDEKTDSVS